MEPWGATQVLTSMVHEWKLIGIQGGIPAVALTVLSCVNSPWFTFLRWPCKVYAIYRMCVFIEPPRSRQGLLPPARILANFIAYVLLTILSLSLLNVKADFNDRQKERYGNVFYAVIEFLWVISVFNLCRGIFMFMDIYVQPGSLTGIVFRPPPPGELQPAHVD